MKSRQEKPGFQFILESDQRRFRIINANAPGARSWHQMERNRIRADHLYIVLISSRPWDVIRVIGSNISI